MGEIEQRPTPGSRLGAPENSGISTLEHGQKPPPTPSGKLMSIKIQMLDDTQEAFEVPVSWGQPSAWGRSSQSCVSVMHSGGKTVCVFSSPLPTVTMLWFRPSYGFSWLMCVDFLIACAEYKWYQWMCHLNFTLTFHILRHVCICLCVCDVYFWVGGNYGFNLSLISFVVVQSLSHVRLSATPWTAAHQASLFFTISQSLLRFISIESEIPSNHLILCCPLLFLPSIFPSIRAFLMSWLLASGGQSIGASASASVLPMNIHNLFFQDWLVWLPSCPRDSQESSPTQQFKNINSLALNLLMVQLSHRYMTTGKTIVLIHGSLYGRTYIWQSNVSLCFFNRLSRLVIAFIQRSKRLLILWLQWFWRPRK